MIVLRDAFPVNVLNAVKACPEVCRVYCATANPLQVIVAESEQGRGILGVIDGFRSKGIEGEADIQKRKSLLRAIGYNSGHFALMVITENAFLVLGGLVTGAISALVAIGPAFLSRGGQLPALSLGLLLIVLVIGLSASVAATVAALRMPLLASLRSE